MKRWHEERKIMLTNARMNDILKRGHLPLGKFRKSNPCDCGNTRCQLCHSDKYPKREKTEKEKISDLDLKEQCEDFNI